MHVYVYACEYVCMYMYMHVYVYACEYVCMYMSMYMHVSMYVCICIGKGVRRSGEMCSLILECVLLLQYVFFCYRMCSSIIEGVLLL